jgi:predicted ATPase
MMNYDDWTLRYTKFTQRVNSKATLKVPLDALLDHVPAALHGEIRRSRYVAARSNTIIVQADDSRKQSDNAHSCYKRLYEAIAEAGRHAVPAETSAEQMQRVKDLYVFLVLFPATLATDRKLIRSQAKVR